MAVIGVAQAEVGMVLAADIVDKRGRMLIPAGKELSEKYLRALQSWGVSHVEVEGDDVGEAGVSDLEPWALEAAAPKVDELFTHTNRAHPAIEALAAICTERIATEIQAVGLGTRDE